MAAALPDVATLNKSSAKLAPVDLVVDVGALPAGERAALGEMIAAAKIMDALFLRQVWAGNETVLLDLVRDRSPLGQARLHAFLQNKGPWLRLEDDRPFLPGVGPKPPAANFYPADATKAEVEKWMQGLPADGADCRGRVLHHHPPRARRQAAGDPVQPRISGRAGSAPRSCCAPPPS